MYRGPTVITLSDYKNKFGVSKKDYSAIKELRALDDEALVKRIKEHYPKDRRVLRCCYPSIYALLRERDLYSSVYPKLPRPNGQFFRKKID